MKVENIQKEVKFTITLTLDELQHITACVGAHSQSQANSRGLKVDTGILYNGLEELLIDNGFTSPKYF